MHDESEYVDFELLYYLYIFLSFFSFDLLFHCLHDLHIYKMYTICCSYIYMLVLFICHSFFEVHLLIESS